MTTSTYRVRGLALTPSMIEIHEFPSFQGRLQFGAVRWEPFFSGPLRETREAAREAFDQAMCER